MKKLGPILVVGIAVVIVIAIVMAGRMGKTSATHAAGTVVVSDDLVDEAKSIKTLFITVFDINQPRPPYGAMRQTVEVSADGTVTDFVLTKERVQRMQPQKPWPKEFRLKARLDQDGSAGMDRPGDLVGELPSVSAGATGLTLKINHKVK